MPPGKNPASPITWLKAAHSEDGDGDGSITVWDRFSVAGISRIEGMTNEAKYGQSVEENLVDSACDCSLWRRFTFQDNNSLTRPAQTTLEWLQDKSLNVLERLSQSLDLDIIENLWRLEDCSAPLSI